ncbi:MAG: holo-ACP synthase [Candidatus Margulisbacteria bacterium]|nr:holo-ACP synthase [Candidatus Margulisiibacteriota bacterium]
MIKGVGIDIIEIDRVKKAVEKFGDAFVKRVFTDHEIDYCYRLNKYRVPELAVRFAAKEAYSKAVGTGIGDIGWKHIEIINDQKGKPQFKIRGILKNNAHVSLSHSRDYAVASVYVEE